jgi:rhodanese-related sulfurtransferase
MDEINHDNFKDLPLDKYIICIDNIGLRSRRAAQILVLEGFLTLYVEGGYDLAIPLIKNKEIF